MFHDKFSLRVICPICLVDGGSPSTLLLMYDNYSFLRSTFYSFFISGSSNRQIWLIQGSSELKQFKPSSYKPILISQVTFYKRECQCLLVYSFVFFLLLIVWPFVKRVSLLTEQWVNCKNEGRERRERKKGKERGKLFLS